MVLLQTTTLGAELNACGCPVWKWGWERVKLFVLIGYRLFLNNFLYQGLLDIHGLLYSPNGGELLGHLPVENFLSFVFDVTHNMILTSGINSKQGVPRCEGLLSRELCEAERC